MLCLVKKHLNRKGHTKGPRLRQRQCKGSRAAPSKLAASKRLGRRVQQAGPKSIISKCAGKKHTPRISSTGLQLSRAGRRIKHQGASDTAPASQQSINKIIAFRRDTFVLLVPGYNKQSPRQLTHRGVSQQAKPKRTKVTGNFSSQKRLAPAHRGGAVIVIGLQKLGGAASWRRELATQCTRWVDGVGWSGVVVGGWWSGSQPSQGTALNQPPPIPIKLLGTPWHNQPRSSRSMLPFGVLHAEPPMHGI
jgi:hypothetical protein